MPLPTGVLRRPLIQAGLALFAAAVAITGVVIAGMDRGYPAQQVRLLSGSAWLPSSGVGQVTLLDGSSGEVAAQVQVAPRGNDLEVVQQGLNAYAVDRSAGTIRRVEGATFELTDPGSPIPDARGGLTAFADPQTLYALDTQRGILATADPRTLRTQGQPLSLAAQLEAGSAKLDESGRLWVVDNDTGDLISIADGDRTTHGGTAKPGHAELTIVDGNPVVIDHNGRKAIAIDPESGQIVDTVELDLRADDEIAVSGSPHSSRLYLVAMRGVLTICDLHADACDNAVPLDAANSKLGAAVEAGNRLFIPDYTTGQVWVIDLTERAVIAQPKILTPPTRFQLLTRDGIVFYNDPASERAGIIDLDGGFRPIAKYDPKDPEKGLAGRQPDPSQLPPPEPTTPPTTPPTTQPPTTQPPTTQPPTTQPPTNQPPTNQPPSNQPPTSPPPPPPVTTPPATTTPPVTTPPPAAPNLQITLSDADPLVNQDVTLQVTNTTGPPPVSANWDFGDGAAASGLTVGHRWTQERTFQVTVQATMSDGSRATTSVSVQVSLLPAPVHVSPADGSQFTHFPRSTTLSWNAVAGAAQYNVEVECLHCGSAGVWTPWINVTTGATTHAFNWVGDQPGRWHVTAVTADGTRGSTSAWWQFSYDTSMPAPVQLSPANGAVFGHYPRTTTYTWQAVTGAAQYQIEIEYLDLGDNTWKPWKNANVSGTSYVNDFVGAQPGRWRVTATTSDGSRSSASSWWTFTYTI